MSDHVFLNNMEVSMRQPHESPKVRFNQILDNLRQMEKMSPAKRREVENFNRWWRSISSSHQRSE